ncbi:integral membrane protein S linking to the trans Golgi network-domain-containing protein [Gorgonomyces haynaldii]|nr:integral membrane protein S linking to the trans Golgi network-domain-containing protein [Gorgonomyces haynaldii]
MRFRHSQFDPWRIITQIASVQLSFYLIVSILLLMMELLFGQPLSLEPILDSTMMDPEVVFGWSIFISNLFAAVFQAYPMLLIVQRGKLCLDFTLTMYGFHLVFTLLYQGLPTLMWWGNMILCIPVTFVLSEYLCQKRELEPISLVRNDVEMQRLTE